MGFRRFVRAATVSAVALLAGTAFAGCGEEPGVDEPAREGLAIPVDGVEYNVYITREMNFEVVPDEAFYEGPEAPRGMAYYGVFLRACNEGDEGRKTAEDFTVSDNQGNEFEPLELPETNAFAYRAQRLGPGDCIPERGSIAEQGSTGGSMLLFQLPLDTTENRPLDLEIRGRHDLLEGRREVKTVELDL